MPLQVRARMIWMDDLLYSKRLVLSFILIQSVYLILQMKQSLSSTSGSGNGGNPNGSIISFLTLSTNVKYKFCLIIELNY